MEIHWISPTDVEFTEIARYSSQILPFLARITHIARVSDGSPQEHAEPVGWVAKVLENSQSTRLHHVEPGVSPVPIYHIGNNKLHLPIYKQSREEAGIVVLHDLSLVDLARGYSHDLGDPDEWLEMMQQQYGDAGMEMAKRSEISASSHFQMVSEYPLFQPFLENALGVVVHSRHALAIVENQLPEGFPVVQLNLPYSDSEEPAVRDYLSPVLRFIFCGHVGPNRRLSEFFDAWGQLESPQRIRLDIYGNVSNARQLERLAKNFGVAQWLNFHGYVEEGQLEVALNEAHFAINLRWPTMGETSASQLRYWSAGLPTLVTDVGWYAELPDNVVCKVSPADEVRNLVEWLEQIVESPDHYATTGAAGREYMLEQHDPDNYARQLVDFAQQCGSSRLAHKCLEREFVNTIADMCEDESTIDLFRQPIDVAVAMFEKNT